LWDWGQIEGLALDLADEVQQQLRLAAARTQVNIRDEHGAVLKRRRIDPHAEYPNRERSMRSGSGYGASMTL